MPASRLASRRRQRPIDGDYRRCRNRPIAPRRPFGDLDLCRAWSCALSWRKVAGRSPSSSRAREGDPLLAACRPGSTLVRRARLFVGALPILLVLAWAWYFWKDQHGLPYDAFTYLGAGERLNVGHSLYGALQPGDRVVGADALPAPLLSPPLIAVLWRPLAALGEWTVYLWWAAAIVALLGTIVVLWARSPLLTGMLVSLTATRVAVELGVANLNSFILPGTVAVFVLWRRGSIGPAMWIAVILTATKLVPVFLIIWLFSVAPARAWRPFLVASATVLAISIAGAGLQAHFDYVAVLVAAGRQQAGNLTWITRVPWASAAAAAVCALVVIAARRRPSLGYLAAVAGLVSIWTAVAPAIAFASPTSFSTGPETDEATDRPRLWEERPGDHSGDGEDG